MLKRDMTIAPNTTKTITTFKVVTVKMNFFIVRFSYSMVADNPLSIMASYFRFSSLNEPRLTLHFPV